MTMSVTIGADGKNVGGNNTTNDNVALFDEEKASYLDVVSRKRNILLELYKHISSPIVPLPSVEAWRHHNSDFDFSLLPIVVFGE